MLQAAGSFGFTAKPDSRCFVFHKALVKYFHRNGPVDKHMSRPIDRTHAANAKAFLDAILVVERVAQKRIAGNLSGNCLVRL
jgi:hypothetical protein